MEVTERIRKLSDLRDAGLLSDAEFEVQRRAVLSQTATTERPTAFGAYDLLEWVGEGGMGTVYRGRHRVASMAARQGGDVAVKLLHLHLARQEGVLDRFREEAETLAALDHPNIVKVHDVVEEVGQVALVMEWVPGRPLSEVIGQETGPLVWERAQRLARPLLAAVAHAHSRGVVHRDLKPDNIRITPEGGLKVLDFGIARLGEGRGRTRTGTGMGTVNYMAPEQYADARSVDARADVYAVGMTLYEMVAGRLPWEPFETDFTVQRRKHSGDLPLPTQFYPSIPPRVVSAIMAALAPDAARRTASVTDLERALFSTEANEAVKPRPVNVAPSAEPSSPYVPIVVGVTLVVALAGALLFLTISVTSALVATVATVADAVPEAEPSAAAPAPVPSPTSTPAVIEPGKEGDALLADAIAAADALNKDAAIAKLDLLHARYPGSNPDKRGERLRTELVVLGKAAPPLDVEWLSGRPASYSDAPATLLVFFEQWCPHCRREVPELATRMVDLKRRGLQIVGLTRITKSSTREKLLTFLTESHVQFPVGREDGAVSLAMGVKGIPAAAIIRRGEVVWRGHPAKLDDARVDLILSR